MFMDAELEQLLVDLESDLVERKASVSDKKAIRETICAFANDLSDHKKAGIIFVGAKDDETCAGLPITDRLINDDLVSMKDDWNITPFPSMRVEKKILNGCEMAVVIVEPSRSPLVRAKGIIWVRVGSRRSIATAEEERRLNEKQRHHHFFSFDIQTVASYTFHKPSTGRLWLKIRDRMRSNCNPCDLLTSRSR